MLRIHSGNGSCVFGCSLSMESEQVWSRQIPTSTVNERKAGSCRAIGTGVITGAADDDPSAIGTYASAGAKFGLAFLWIAPVVLPMMYVVVYLSAKLGRVYGKGLFAVIRDRYSRRLLYPLWWVRSPAT